MCRYDYFDYCANVLYHIYDIIIFSDSILPDDDAAQQIRNLCAQLQSLHQQRASLREFAKSSIAQLAAQCSVFCPQTASDEEPNCCKNMNTNIVDCNESGVKSSIIESSTDPIDVGDIVNNRENQIPSSDNPNNGIITQNEQLFIEIKVNENEAIKEAMQI